MGRTLLFDPSAGQAFADQWQRYDWQLLRSSPVHRFDPDADLRAATAELTRLGYLVHELDAAGWRTADDLHGALAAALSFPDHYGGNLDALNDVLHDVAGFDYGSDPARDPTRDPASTGTVLAIRNFRRVVEIDRRLAHQVLDLFADAARYGALLGHLMLCLVGCAAELDPVGATPVLLARPPAR